MFVDVGRVDGGDPEYLTWDGARDRAGQRALGAAAALRRGPQQIHYGPGPDDYGPFYAYEKRGEDLDGWRERVRSDIDWGQKTLADHISGVPAARLRSPVRQLRSGRHQRRADPGRPSRLAHQRYDAVFTQDVNARARAEPTAARPDPGDPRDHRRRAPRDSALRRALTAQSARSNSAAQLREDLSAVLELLAAGAITPQVAARYPLTDAAAALRHAESGGIAGKVILVP